MTEFGFMMGREEKVDGQRANKMKNFHPVSGKALAAGTTKPSGNAPDARIDIHRTLESPISPVADAVGNNSSQSHPPLTLFITWTTYGSWLPGDSRGWRKWRSGQRTPQPLLEDWCRNRMKGKAVVLDLGHRQVVEAVCREHALVRGWALYAIAVRSNHVHIAVTAEGVPAKVRDQFKANGTRVLRQASNPITNEKIWTKGGDVEIVDTEEELYRVVLYITEAQERMEHRE